MKMQSFVLFVIYNPTFSPFPKVECPLIRRGMLRNVALLLSPATLLIIIEPIGSGASCKVWSAINFYGDFKVAIKFLNSSRKAFELGKQEFSLLTQIKHPNILRLF
jgi:serine/threonine protein kinase